MKIKINSQILVEKIDSLSSRKANSQKPTPRPAPPDEQLPQ